MSEELLFPNINYLNSLPIKQFEKEIKHLTDDQIDLCIMVLEERLREIEK